MLMRPILDTGVAIARIPVIRGCFLRDANFIDVVRGVCIMSCRVI